MCTCRLYYRQMRIRSHAGILQNRWLTALVYFLFYFILFCIFFLFIVLCVFVYFIITAALCVLISGWMDKAGRMWRTDSSPKRRQLGGFPSEHRHLVRYGKTRMVYIATGWWKKIEDTFIRLDMIHERDNRHTHTDTAWRRRPRLCIASRGKNYNYFHDFRYASIRKTLALIRK